MIVKTRILENSTVIFNLIHLFLSKISTNHSTRVRVPRFKQDKGLLAKLFSNWLSHHSMRRRYWWRKLLNEKNENVKFVCISPSGFFSSFLACTVGRRGRAKKAVRQFLSDSFPGRKWLTLNSTWTEDRWTLVEPDRAEFGWELLATVGTCCYHKQIQGKSWPDRDRDMGS